MDKAQLKIAALGALGGAALSVIIVFASAALGAFPLNGEQVKRYLMANPTILVEMMAKVQDQQAADADRVQNEIVAKLGPKALFDPKVAYVTGPANAKNTLVEFFDYNCVHCRNSLAAMKKYYAEHKGDTRFAFVDFPIFGEMSDEAARTAIAARKQGDKYVAFSFLLMGEKGAITSTDQILADAKAAGLDIPKLIADMKDPETDKTMAAAHLLAKQLKIDGTPSFVGNGRFHAGELTYEELRDFMAGKDL
ncbi:MAG: thioredoxin domain-containing protein [Alphaproteobacteria bacterium]|nr:thioredoxin domain-containing protein [Alphaproteobacteria bacterium]MBL6940262.1 thioredoxin domain-containing protein [Alphaproteobacteria bacterium]MBL7096830.1 thioredoxin domain-containing protein [Alphaproteobacteria bacterium]